MLIQCSSQNDKNSHFIWVDNGKAFSAFGTDHLNGGKTLKMLCSACKFARHLVDKVCLVPFGEPVVVCSLLCKAFARQSPDLGPLQGVEPPPSA